VLTATLHVVHSIKTGSDPAAPSAPAARAGLLRVDDQPIDTQPAHRLRGARLLVVDDDPLNLGVALELLEAVGARVWLAQDGQQAIDLLRQHSVDGVLMDVQMPVMDGLQATRLIRADPALAGVRIVAMTANAQPEDEARCRASGMDDFLGKPVLPERLYATLARWIACGPAPAGPAVVLAADRLAGDPNVIDLSILVGRLGGDRSRVRNLALMFQKGLGKTRHDIDAALAAEDLDRLGALGHQAKSAASTIGAMALAALFQALEDAQLGGDLERARLAVATMAPLMKRISEHLDRVLA